MCSQCASSSWSQSWLHGSRTLSTLTLHTDACGLRAVNVRLHFGTTSAHLCFVSKNEAALSGPSSHTQLCVADVWLMCVLLPAINHLHQRWQDLTPSWNRRLRYTHTHTHIHTHIHTYKHELTSYNTRLSTRTYTHTHTHTYTHTHIGD